MDLNEINASKMNAFKNAINRQADREIEDLTAKIREQRNAAERIRGENEAREALTGFRAERSQMELKYKRELSRCDYDTQKQVLTRRKELVEEFFGGVEAELRGFTEGKEYDGYIKRQLAKAEEALGKDCVILAAPKDVKKVAALAANEVRPDNSIMIGGICAVDEKRGLFCDYTLDRALAEEKEAFCNRPELRT